MQEIQYLTRLQHTVLRRVLVLTLSSIGLIHFFIFFFFQAEDGIRDVAVTGVQTCALPICRPRREDWGSTGMWGQRPRTEIGRASGRERGEISGVAVSLKKKKREKSAGRWSM